MQGAGTSALGWSGGNIGEFGNIVAASFHSWSNNFVGINHGNPYDRSNGASIGLGDGYNDIGSATVAYDAAIQRLSLTATISVDGTPYNVSLSETTNLFGLFGPTMYI